MLFTAQKIGMVCLLTCLNLHIPQRRLISPLGGLGRSCRAAHSCCGAQPQASVRGSRCVLRACLPLESIIPATSIQGVCRTHAFPLSPNTRNLYSRCVLHAAFPLSPENLQPLFSHGPPPLSSPYLPSFPPQLLQKLFDSVPRNFLSELVCQDPRVLCVSSATMQAKFSILMSKYGSFQVCAWGWQETGKILKDTGSSWSIIAAIR